ncbi:hypothetical protein BZA05DRAFT_398119 [Tricharina praecox]|uniref:uncharacterized protein n=1 Tax=Tricharina praecox TaxID=43433 RepID=UPI00221F198B|nr:uncharacterized protein BZA05DRAFT_398119 [Tricharina praecox]KAI5851873.1 hypothetical protein BZA05DRAFT_398119 [Tricharina praecox]
MPVCRGRWCRVLTALLPAQLLMRSMSLPPLPPPTAIGYVWGTPTRWQGTPCQMMTDEFPRAVEPPHPSAVIGDTCKPRSGEDVPVAGHSDPITASGGPTGERNHRSSLLQSSHSVSIVVAFCVQRKHRHSRAHTLSALQHVDRYSGGSGFPSSNRSNSASFMFLRRSKGIPIPQSCLRSEHTPT